MYRSFICAVRFDAALICSKRHHPFRIVEKVCEFDQQNLHTSVLERVTLHLIASFALFSHFEI